VAWRNLLRHGRFFYIRATLRAFTAATTTFPLPPRLPQHMPLLTKLPLPRRATCPLNRWYGGRTTDWANGGEIAHCGSLTMRATTALCCTRNGAFSVTLHWLSAAL